MQNEKLVFNVLIVGATGLIGSTLLDLLEKDIMVGEIHVLVRRDFVTKSKKIKVHLFDFQNYNSLSSLFRKINVVYCCVGTTIKKAGSKVAFRAVDFDIPVNIAQIASANKVDRFVVISSLGADEQSSNFYLKTKGEMEKAVEKYSFLKLAFLRPSLLLGPRSEFRFGEKVAQFFMLLFSFLMIGRFAKYKPISCEEVANAMIKISYGSSNTRYYESDEIKWISN